MANPPSTFNWTGTLTLNGSTFTMVWRDTFFLTTFTFNFPAANSISFTVRDDPDVFTLNGQFAADLQSISGTLNAQIDCVVAVRSVTGMWTGRRTGP